MPTSGDDLSRELEAIGKVLDASKSLIGRRALFRRLVILVGFVLGVWVLTALLKSRARWWVEGFAALVDVFLVGGSAWLLYSFEVRARR